MGIPYIDYIPSANLHLYHLESIERSLYFSKSNYFFGRNEWILYKFLSILQIDQAIEQCDSTSTNQV